MTAPQRVAQVVLQNPNGADKPKASAREVCGGSVQPGFSPRTSRDSLTKPLPARCICELNAESSPRRQAGGRPSAADRRPSAAARAASSSRRASALAPSGAHAIAPAFSAQLSAISNQFTSAKPRTMPRELFWLTTESSPSCHSQSGQIQQNRSTVTSSQWWAHFPLEPPRLRLHRGEGFPCRSAVDRPISIRLGIDRPRWATRPSRPRRAPCKTAPGRVSANQIRVPSAARKHRAPLSTRQSTSAEGGTRQAPPCSDS